MNPIKSGCKSYSGGESWTNWWLFPRLTDDQVADVLEQHDIGAHYSAPGSTFTRCAWVRHSRSYTLVTQEGGWDV
jgi:hypothetical protein